MLVSIRAKFRTIRDAELAFNEVKSKIKSEKVDLLTNRNIEEHVKEQREGKLMWGTIKSALMGAIVGLIVGVGFTYLFSVNGQEISTFLASSVFIMVGAAAGVVFSTAIYYISREKNLSVSENDLKYNEAMIIVTLKDKALSGLRRVLTSHNVEKIYRT